MKKILFIIDNLKGGGAEKAIKIIVEGLYEKGYDPSIILLEDKKDYVINKNVKIFSLSNNLTKYNFIMLFFSLLKLLKNINPDIVYATNTKSQVLSLLTKPFFKTKRVINIQVDLTKQYDDRKYIFYIFNKLLKCTDTYSFISYGIYENLKKEIIERENIFIPNAIDFVEIDTLKKEEIDDKYKHIFEKKVFITIGRLTEQKGQWNLLKAFSLLDGDNNLIILGSGEKEVELKELAIKYNIYNKVFFLGFQKNPFKFLYQSDIFVLSSLWEGFGNVIVEAMRCNLPIISTDCPSGPREIIAPNSDVTQKLKDAIDISEYGILVDDNNPTQLYSAMNIMVNDDSLSLGYRAKSKERAQEYSKDLIVNKFIKEFEL